MGKMTRVDNLEQLRKYLDDKGVLEIAIRDKKKKFVAFQKVVLNTVPQGEERELLNKAIHLINKNNQIAEKNLKVISNVAKLQQFSLLLNGMNLCATCAGFAIMYAKLDKVSGQINRLMNVVRQGNEVQADFEFKKVISEHSNMLDSRKTQKYYTEEQMRKLVDDEYNVLNMIIDVFMKDLSEDSEPLVDSIFSLASMLAVSLRYFDELYYFNNKEAIGDGDVWHSSHDNWMAVFKRLSDDRFIKKIQDYCIFDLELTTAETDMYYLSFFDQVKELVEDVEDNQMLIKAFDDESTLADYFDCLKKEVADEIQDAFKNTEGAMENPEVMKVYQEAMKQVALAV